MLSLNEQQQWKGFARLFRPTLAGANMGPPSGFVWSVGFGSSSDTVSRQGLSPCDSKSKRGIGHLVRSLTGSKERNFLTNLRLSFRRGWLRIRWKNWIG